MHRHVVRLSARERPHPKHQWSMPWLKQSATIPGSQARSLISSAARRTSSRPRTARPDSDSS
ncbi:hypothetical protein ACFPRL_14450 [Pseudoclavibacter helvolus]